MDDQVFDKGERVTKTGLIVVAFLGILKGAVGLLTGSVALTAQAVDSITDLVSLSAVFLGLRISRRPPSDRFSYGYYRVETVVSLIIAILILITGGYMLNESVNRVFTPAILQDPVIVLVTAGVSIPILLWLGRYTRKVGAEINSQAVLSQSEDFITDLYSSLVVIVGVTGSWLGYPVLEGISGGVISLLIIKMGLQLSWSSLLVLMDAVEKPDQLVSIVKMSESVPGVIAAKNVRMRRSGPFCFGEVTIQVGETLDVEKAHRLSHEVEDRVKESITSLESLIVHIEPVKRKKHLLAMPIDIDEEWDSKLSSHFGSAPFFIIFEVNSSIKLLHVIRNPALGLEKKKGVVVSEMLIREKVTALISDELGEGPFHILRDSYVSIYRSKGGTPISKVINSFQDELVEPRGKG